MLHNYSMFHKKKSLLPWLSAIILFLFFCSACSVKQPQRQTTTEVEDTGSELAEERPTTPPEEPSLSPLELLENQADNDVASGNYREALNRYNYLLAKYPVEKRSALLEKIEPVLSEMKINDLALILKSEVNRIPESMILYKLGLNHAARGNYTGAREVLTQFVSKYPSHPDARDARDILNLMRNQSFRKNRFGCLLPLSGKFALFGQKALKGIQMALRDLTPLYQDKITLMIKDTESSDEKAVQCVEELAKANVAAIAGPMVTATAAATEAEAKKIPTICMTQKSGVTGAGEYIFSNFLTPEMQVNALLNHSYHTLGIRKFSILYPEDKYGTTYMKLFTQMVEETGGEIDAMESYGQDHIDFSDVVRKMARAGRGRTKSSVIQKAVFIPDAPPKLAMILPQFAYQNMNDIYLLGTNIWHHEYLLKEAGGYVKNAVITEGFFAGSQKTAPAHFAETFRMIYGESPGFIEAIAYDTVSILIRTAMEPEIESRLSLKNALAGNRIFEGVTGKTMFELSGKAHKELFFLTVQNNQFVEISSN